MKTKEMRLVASLLLLAGAVSAQTRRDGVSVTYTDSEVIEESGHLKIDPGSDRIRVIFTNKCSASVQLYWLHTNGQEEVWISDLKPNEEVAQYTDVDHTFRVKWADKDVGRFGKDILEEHVMPWNLQMDQRFFVCGGGKIRHPGQVFDPTFV